MTQEQFLRELRKLRGNGWRLRDDEIRCRRGACPINAVMYARDKTHPEKESTHSAQRRLGLRSARTIVSAADLPTSLLGGARFGRALRMREAMLKALGLKERRA